MRVDQLPVLISIPALREEGDRPPSSLAAIRASISIPALREEGDLLPSMAAQARAISIPALREEGDRVLGLAHIQRSRFLSPPSARRATSTFRPTGEPSTFLSPPSARRATQGRPGEAAELCISIPALREEGDFRYPVLIAFTLLFLSPPSARRAT